MCSKAICRAHRVVPRARTSSDVMAKSLCVANSDCDGWGKLDGTCDACSTPTASRLTCVSCGLNTTVNDYLVSKEAW